MKHSAYKSGYRRSLGTDNSLHALSMIPLLIPERYPHGVAPQRSNADVIKSGVKNQLL